MKVMAMCVYIYNEKTRQDKTCKSGNCFESFLATTPKQARVCEKKLDNKLELCQNSLTMATTSASKCILFSCSKLRY